VVERAHEPLPLASPLLQIQQMQQQQTRQPCTEEYERTFRHRRKSRSPLRFASVEMTTGFV
jgi:hypothetical protein